MAQMPKTVEDLGLMPGTSETIWLSDEEVDSVPFANTDSNGWVADQTHGRSQVEFANSSSDFETNEESHPSDFLLPTLVYRSNAQEMENYEAEVGLHNTEKLCSLSCNKSCSINTHQWSITELQTLKSSFVHLKKSKTKENVLKHLLFQQRAGIAVRGIFVKNTMLCKKYFSHMTGISMHIINMVFKDYYLGVQRYMHGNCHRFKESVACVNFISWMKVFSKNFGQDAPDDIATILPAFLYKERPNINITLS